MKSFSRYISSIIGILLLLSISWLRHDQSFSFAEPLKYEWQPLASYDNYLQLHLRTFNAPPQQVSIPDLLTQNGDYHRQLVSVKGQILQPELHLDKTEIYIDFVFRLSQGAQSIVVYGRHDRTLGAPSIIVHRSVEVTGIFWKEQDRAGTTVYNVLEATSVVPYPSSVPGST